MKRKSLKKEELNCPRIPALRATEIEAIIRDLVESNQSESVLRSLFKSR